MSLRVIEDQFRGFLNDRMDGDTADAELCYRIVARHDPSDLTTPNFFMAVPNPVDIKRAGISQTTLAALEKAGLSSTSTRDIWHTPGGHRQIIRPGRWARSLTDIEDGNILDVFIMALDARFAVGESRVELLEGKAIKKAYSVNSHCRCESIGDLANSCMRYEQMKSYFSIYEKTAKLAVVKCKTCGGIQARAIAWENGDIKYVDRRYGTQQNKQAILTHLTNLGYIDVWPGSVGSEHRRTFVLPFPHERKDIPYAPYVDSLFYWCRTCKTLSNRGSDCTRNGHDLATLRGQRGVDHPGWWGLCPNCKGQLRSDGSCANQKSCPGCGETWCGGGTCPNGCVRCTGCNSWRRKEQPGCPHGCLICTHCQTANRKEYLNQAHGRCRSCGEEVADDASVVYRLKMKWNSIGHLQSRCPYCDWRIVQKEFSPMQGLEKCEHIHNGPYVYEGGHCPQCHAHIILENTDAPRPSRTNYESTDMYTFRYTTGTSNKVGW